jgi:hypothetical protein
MTDAASACAEAGWTTFTPEDAFSFCAPRELRGGPEQGTDSAVGMYELTGLKLSYDYGAFSSTLTEWSSNQKYATRPVTVDGRSATVVTAIDPASTQGTLLAGIHVPHASGGAKLTMWASCRSESDQQLALRMFETIRF